MRKFLSVLVVLVLVFGLVVFEPAPDGALAAGWSVDRFGPVQWSRYCPAGQAVAVYTGVKNLSGGSIYAGGRVEGADNFGHIKRLGWGQTVYGGSTVWKTLYTGLQNVTHMYSEASWWGNGWEIDVYWLGSYCYVKSA